MTDEPVPLASRRSSRPVHVGNVQVGGDAPVVVQTMTNTDTADADATIEQVARLADAGAEIVRIAVPDRHAAAAVPEIVKRTPVPLIVKPVELPAGLVFLSADCEAILWVPAPPPLMVALGSSTKNPPVTLVAAIKRVFVVLSALTPPMSRSVRKPDVGVRVPVEAAAVDPPVLLFDPSKGSLEARMLLNSWSVIVPVLAGVKVAVTDASPAPAESL